MQKITQKDKKILIVLGIVIVLLMYFQFILMPSLNSISKSKSTINDLNLKLDRMNLTRIQNISMKKKLKKLSKDYAASQSKLPVNERNPEIEYDLQNMASSNNVVISSMSFSDPEEFSDSDNKKNPTNKNNNLIQIPVNMQVTGSSEDNVMAFLKAFESANRISQIKSSGINFNSDKSSYVLDIYTKYFYVANKSKEKVNYDFASGK